MIASRDLYPRSLGVQPGYRHINTCSHASISAPAWVPTTTPKRGYTTSLGRTGDT